MDAARRNPSPRRPVAAEFGWPGGDSPGAADFRSAPSPAAAAALQRGVPRLLGRPAGSSISAASLRPGTGISGTYRLSAAGGDYLARISSRLGNPGLEMSYLDHLHSRGVPASRIIATGCLSDSGRRFRIDLRRFIPGRHFDGSDRDIRALAGVLASAHRALRGFPGAERVRRVAARRMGRLAGTLARMGDSLGGDRFSLFAEHAGWARRRKGWLRKMMRAFSPAFHRRPGAQCLHAELHPGNVLFEARTGRPYLLDPEEGVRFFAPPHWDLAYLIQRFCLRDQPGQSALSRRLAAVRTGYGPLPDALPLAMRDAAWYCVAVIVDQRLRDGISTPASELEKFRRMERQAAALEDRLG